MSHQNVQSSIFTVELVCFQCRHVFTKETSDQETAEIFEFLADCKELAPICPLCRDSVWRDTVEGLAPHQRPCAFPHTPLYEKRRYHMSYIMIPWNALFTLEVYPFPTCDTCDGPLPYQIDPLYDGTCPRCGAVQIPW